MDHIEVENYIDNELTKGSVYGLDRIKELLKRLSFPQNDMRIIHIAGTNGKGSVSRMIMSILCYAGYNVGIFNSPFLEKRNEYLCCNGVDASEAEYDMIAGIVRNAIEGERLSLEPMEQKPTEFEFSFAMAMEYFSRKQCDFAIIECGLGGRNDATNVFSEKEMSIITNIGLDHTGLLGDSIAKIAGQKCGIILKGDTVIAYPSGQEAMKVIKRTCRERKAELVTPEYIDYGSEMKYYYLGIADRSNILMKLPCLLDNISLKGEFQKKNAMVALSAALVLKNKGFRISKKAVSDGLKNTKWPGRFEILRENPLIIADGGHNTQCVRALCDTLDKMEIKKAILVVGIMADKDYAGVFRILAPYADTLIATEPDNPRSLNAEEIVKHFEGIESYIEREPAKAVSLALKIADKKSSDRKAIVITGSLYMMSDVRKAIL